ncbi:hypothetical protein J502_1045 [Acinetobacter sp. 1294596]|uniref:Uncharacterized protein n=1 Tax=Acinetobacter radioresistens SK82 TaxID=596318 RepID=A0ABM9YQ16_ACIRA|nr:hypothetical protein ACIRA0001_0906 [Acinetobacter radioresistens SK82]EXB32432.1 hypothetical protein J546_2156 [Acinetobacter sp. 1461402]EXB71305.1 hypothetical protein J550_2080 [Acinetobacter sp. 230853]EXB87395.1 hypothetical protein J538_0580 [Acinetobacter sp. 272263]EXC32184.1 hypothetical protein J520_1780 [Acinetobacter sp. 869535]EXE13504.1 hypothetical protein J559_2384 [Acinetobacter sp. 983759]EXE57861.1 hypothetical protein J579_1817 [Acinetobacter sp. 1239920]EXF57725.1 h
MIKAAFTPPASAGFFNIKNLVNSLYTGFADYKPQSVITLQFPAYCY